MHAPSLDGAGLERRVLYEHDGLIVLDKPWGWPSSGRTLEDPDCLQFHLIKRARRMVWAVHQLDADTSGLNVFIRRKSLVPVWQQRLRYPVASKSYRALVHGSPDWDRKRLSAPIDFVQSPTFRGQAVTSEGKRAVTRFEVMSRSALGPFSMIRATLETGRTHQVRVHLKHLGLSLVGEQWYRPEPCQRHHRQALHAEQIEFRDGGDPDALAAPLPVDLADLARELGL